MRRKIIGIFVCILLIVTPIPAVTCIDNDDLHTTPSSNNQHGSFAICNDIQTQNINLKYALNNTLMKRESVQKGKNSGS